MSSIRITPAKWFANTDENKICCYAKLANSKSIYAEIHFRNSIVISSKYEIDVDYLQNNLPICEVEKQGAKYKLYFQNKSYKETVLAYLKQRDSIQITDENRSLLSKFFITYNISPGNMQEIFNLHHLDSSILANENNLPKIDFYYSFTHIESIFDNAKVMNSATFMNYRLSTPTIYSTKTFVFVNIGTSQINLLTLYPNNYIKNTVIISTTENIPTLHDNIAIIKCTSFSQCISQFYSLINSTNPDAIVHYSENSGNSQEKLLKSLPYTIINLALLYEREFIEIPALAQTLPVLERYILGTDYMTPEVSQNTLASIRKSCTQLQVLGSLWKQNNLENNYAALENFWKATIEHILVTDEFSLFSDLLPMFNIEEPACKGRDALFEVTRKKGIYTNCNLYSLSQLYCNALSPLGSLNSPSTFGSIFSNGSNSVGSNNSNTNNMNKLIEYFRSSDKCHIPYLVFGTTTVQSPTSQDMIVWADGRRLWTPILIPSLKKIDNVKLILSTTESCLEVSNDTILDIGIKPLLKQPFPLILKYIYHIISSLNESSNDPIVFPEMIDHFSDFELDMRIYANEMKEIFINFDHSSLTNTNIRKIIVDQLKHMKIRFSPENPNYMDIKYIITTDGPVIDKIYLKDLSRYMRKINFEYYNSTLKKILAELIE